MHTAVPAHLFTQPPRTCSASQQPGPDGLLRPLSSRDDLCQAVFAPGAGATRRLCRPCQPRTVTQGPSRASPGDLHSRDGDFTSRAGFLGARRAPWQFTVSRRFCKGGCQVTPVGMTPGNGSVAPGVISTNGHLARVTLGLSPLGAAACSSRCVVDSVRAPRFDVSGSLVLENTQSACLRLAALVSVPLTLGRAAEALENLRRRPPCSATALHSPSAVTLAAGQTFQKEDASNEKAAYVIWGDSVLAILPAPTCPFSSPDTAAPPGSPASRFWWLQVAPGAAHSPQSLALCFPYKDASHCIEGHPTQGDPIFTSDIGRDPVSKGTHHKLGPAGEPQPSPPSGPGPAPAPAGASSWGITAGTTIPFARALALAPQVVLTVIPTPGQSPAVGTKPTRVAKEAGTA
ncbi:hypothetical protein J1605_003627 [Eschrichtius robustus]|uniref:Uncharacterized protein n=1 Tax=Eschrichtius robustus TaxID=9764 RepID=A0AB34HQ73_ESCRO|nr:hypothetical protein J1605_003627 [Eschrichtius robustus]